MRTFTCLLLAVVSALVPAVAGGIQVSGTSVELGGIPYYVPPEAVGQLEVDSDVRDFVKGDDADFIPFSVVSKSESRSLASTFSSWKTKDDVWSEWFLMGLSVQDESSVSKSIKSTYNIKFIFKSPSAALPSGPYFLSPLTGKVYQAYRLYTDENQAFLYGVLPAGDGSYKQLSAHTDGAHTSTVGVPSRLYFTPTAAKPFAGYRLAVKDIYDVAGLKTGCGNRAFYQTYPAKNTTAPAIQRLIDVGMVIIGKAKTSQFANGEISTDDWVDLHAPYNPRGDGYQDASSSSTGPGSALSSYDWVDFTVGSDTGGSMRGPAGKCGLYGNRPSHGAVPLDNVMPLSPALDTGGIFSRDAILWAQVGKVWYKDFKDYTKYPKKLLFPVDGFGTSYTTNPPADGTSDATLNSFLKQVEGFLGINRTEINLGTMWMETGPANLSSSSLDVLLNLTYPNLIAVDQTMLVRKPFFEAYGAIHGGRTPFVDPSPTTRWGYGLTLSESQYQDAITNKTAFQTWIASEVLRGNQSDTCSDAILVYPQSDGSTLYRNTYLRPPTVPFGWSFGRLAVHAEVPDMVVPVGEQSYLSTITNETEYLPVTMSFLAAKNCDLMLFNLFAELQKRGILSKLSTGSRLF